MVPAFILLVAIVILVLISCHNFFFDWNVDASNTTQNISSEEYQYMFNSSKNYLVNIGGNQSLDSGAGQNASQATDASATKAKPFGWDWWQILIIIGVIIICPIVMLSIWVKRKRIKEVLDKRRF